MTYPTVEQFRSILEAMIEPGTDDPSGDWVTAEIADECDALEQGLLELPRAAQSIALFALGFEAGKRWAEAQQLNQMLD